MSRLIAFAGVVVLTTPAHAVVVTVAPPAGHFQMRAELQGVHPRLHFTTADIAAIRARALGSANWYLEDARGAFGHYVSDPVNIDDSWKNYLFGFWGQFTMVMLYIAEQDQAHADTAIDWALWYARDTSWLADDLIPMEITTGMALTYDALYDQLTVTERGEIRAALVEAMELIHPAFFVGQYWTNDFQNNHMHNRIHGLAHAAFAIYGDDPGTDVQAHADLALSAFEQMLTYLPADGSTHEGPGYWDYGRHWIVRLTALMEHVTGNDYSTSNPHFQNDYYYRIYLSTPGWQNTFNVGDGGGGISNITTMALGISQFGDARAMSVLRHLMTSQPDAFYQHSAWGVLWYDGDLTAEPYQNLPLWRFWPDLEMFSIRSSWEDDATGLVFKCGPPGGHHMQGIRGTEYVNIAHDHPDQNHLLLFAHGDMLAQDDDYPKPSNGGMTLTRNHNTLVIDGEGGPEEGGPWYQPFPYNETAYLDDVLLSQSSAYAAGNASRLYAGADLFVRHIAFFEGEYVILIDEVEGAGGTSHDYQWRLHNDGTWGAGAAGEFFVDTTNARLAIQFLEPDPATLTSSFLPAEATAKPSLAVSSNGTSARFVSVLVPQQGGSPAITSQLESVTGGVAVSASLGTTSDLFLIGDAATVEASGVAATGAAFMLRRASNVVTVAVLARGTAVTVDGAKLLGASSPTNIVWRPNATGGTLEAEAPYRITGGSTTVEIGGLTPSTPHTYAVDGAPAIGTASDASGVALLSLDLSERRTVVLTEGEPPPPPDGGTTGGDGDVVPGGDSDASGPGASISGGCGCSGTAGSWALLAVLWLVRRRRC